MTSRFRLRPNARADLDAIWRYVARDHERAANDLIDRIMSRVEMLADFPSAGRERNELAPGLRSFSVEPVVIFYIARAGIDIVRVIHGRRKIIASDFDN